MNASTTNRGTTNQGATNPTSLHPTAGQLALAELIKTGEARTADRIEHVPASHYTCPDHFAREKAALSTACPKCCARPLSCQTQAWQPPMMRQAVRSSSPAIMRGTRMFS